MPWVGSSNIWYNWEDFRESLVLIQSSSPTSFGNWNNKCTETQKKMMWILQNMTDNFQNFPLCALGSVKDNLNPKFWMNTDFPNSSLLQYRVQNFKKEIIYLIWLVLVLLMLSKATVEATFTYCTSLPQEFIISGVPQEQMSLLNSSQHQYFKAVSVCFKLNRYGII